MQLVIRPSATYGRPACPVLTMLFRSHVLVVCFLLLVFAALPWCHFHVQFEVEAKELELSRLLAEEKADTKWTKEVKYIRSMMRRVSRLSHCLLRYLTSRSIDLTGLLPQYLLGFGVRK